MTILLKDAFQITLQERYRDDLTLVQAEDLALQILKQVMEDKLNNVNVEMASVTQTGYHLYDGTELDSVIRRLPAGH